MRSQQLAREKRRELLLLVVHRAALLHHAPPRQRAAQHGRLAGLAVHGRGGALERAADAGLVLLRLGAQLLLPGGL